MNMENQLLIAITHFIKQTEGTITEVKQKEYLRYIDELTAIFLQSYNDM